MRPKHGNDVIKKAKWFDHYLSTERYNRQENLGDYEKMPKVQSMNKTSFTAGHRVHLNIDGNYKKWILGNVGKNVHKVFRKWKNLVKDPLLNNMFWHFVYTYEQYQSKTSKIIGGHGVEPLFYTISHKQAYVDANGILQKGTGRF